MVDIDSFKAGMRRLAAGVTVITTASDAGDNAGATATAVCSVTAAPPTLLCCLNRASATYAAIRANARLAVNVLSVSDREIANRFASPITSEEKFRHGLWCRKLTGAPVLESALVSFDCRVSDAVDVGTHGILFAAIEAVTVREGDAKPLLYAHGAYGGFASEEEARRASLLWMPNWLDG